MTIESEKYCEVCTGDVCKGDKILFTEAVFCGSYRRPKFLGERRIAARVVRDSYGGEKQQHTFTLEIVGSDGHDPLKAGVTIRRRGRNIYRNGTMREKWANESERKIALGEKHLRGHTARTEREERKNVHHVL